MWAKLGFVSALVWMTAACTATDDGRGKGGNTSDDTDATELARSQESLQSHLHAQALALRLGEHDRAALRFLIESLNDDGYLEDSLPALAHSLAGDDAAQVDDLLHHFTVALHLLQSLEPVGVGARDLVECLRLQLQALLAAEGLSEPRQAVICLGLRICAQPLDLRGFSATLRSLECDK